MNNVIADFNEYFRNGRELKDRGIEQERIESYLSAFVTFTEAIHHFNMAVYLLVNDLDRTLSLREKNSHKEGRQIANKIEDMIVRYNMPLCNRIRESEYAKTKHSLSVAEQHILDQLAIMCLRCEAKLHMIMHKAQTSHQDHFKTIQNNKELIKRVDEQTETVSLTLENIPVHSFVVPIIGSQLTNLSFLTRNLLLQTVLNSFGQNYSIINSLV